MGGQTWIADILAAVMLATAGYCLSRLVISWRQGRSTDRPVDGVHVVMGVAMAGMLVPGLRFFRTGGWEIIFGASALGFAWLAVREMRTPKSACDRPRHHHLQHVLACAAMVYMLAAVTTTAAHGASGNSGMSGMGGGARFPTLALILTLGLLGYVVWTADRLTSFAPVPALATAAAPVGDLVLAGGGKATRPASTAATDLAADRRPRPLSPRQAACVEIAMGVTMGYMLILML